MKRLFCIIAALCCLAACTDDGKYYRDHSEDDGGGSGEVERKATFVVGSFNLRGDIDSGDNSWSNRRPRVIARVRDNGFDLFGTQECYASMLEDIKTNAPEYDYYGQYANFETWTSGKPVYSAIFYRTDRFVFVEGGEFWFSETPDVPYSYSWNPNWPRVCSWVKLRDKNTDRIFYMFNSHFDNKGDRDADTHNQTLYNSALVLRNKVDKIAGEAPVIATGDFNSGPDTDAIKNAILLDDYFYDSYAVSLSEPAGPAGSYYGYNFSKEPTSRIDYVFVTDHFKVYDFKIIDTDFTEQRSASDHLPIMATVTIK